MKILKITATILMLIVMFFAAIPFTKGLFMIGSLLTIGVFGAVLACWYIKPLSEFIKSKKPLKILYRIAGVFIIIGLVYAAIPATHILTAQVKTAPNDDVTLVVLGCQVHGTRPSLMLITRLEAAKKFLNDNPNVKCIVSGGQGPGEDITEAKAMKTWLAAHGIDENRVFEEGKSTSTVENLQYSKEIIQREKFPEKIVIATDDYHEYRAGEIAKTLGMESYSAPAKTPWWLYECHFVRELMAITKFWIFG